VPLDADGCFVKLLLHVAFLFLDLSHPHFDDSFIFFHLSFECLLIWLKLHKKLLLLVNFTYLFIKKRIVLSLVRIHTKSTSAHEGVLGIAHIQVVGSVLVAACFRLQLVRQHRSLMARSVYIDESLVTFYWVLALILSAIHEMWGVRGLRFVKLTFIQLMIFLIFFLWPLHHSFSVRIQCALGDRISLGALSKYSATGSLFAESVCRWGMLDCLVNLLRMLLLLLYDSRSSL
jgi:hypothetical protein